MRRTRKSKTSKGNYRPEVFGAKPKVKLTIECEACGKGSFYKLFVEATNLSGLQTAFLSGLQTALDLLAHWYQIHLYACMPGQKYGTVGVVEAIKGTNSKKK